MKKQLKLWSVIAGAVACSLTSFGEVPLQPVVSDVAMAQDNNRLVTITYQIADASGIVTLDILTNGVSIGAENIQFVNGDVNKEVVPGSHTITWRPDKSWPGHKVENATAKVCVWSKSAPPNYMAVSLVDGSVNWYTCTNALPEGVGSDRYRENILLMRHICQPNGGKWVMGSPQDGEGWREESREALHPVTLTNDYWIGVFEITQKQWSLVAGGQPSSFKGEHWATRPVENVSYDMVRGTEESSFYPNDPDSNSFLGKIRKITGITSFDLPSEMQWEYACRAGTSSALNNGAAVTNPWGQDTEMDKVGRYIHNGGSTLNHARVGSYPPNAWGIYDMHGNVWEWCLDWFSEDISGLDGFVNTNTGDTRILRGGSWNFNAAHCRSAVRYDNDPSGAENSFGFRVVCSENF